MQKMVDDFGILLDIFSCSSTAKKILLFFPAKLCYN
jgi:hypothetical protein